MVCFLMREHSEMRRKEPLHTVVNAKLNRKSQITGAPAGHMVLFKGLIRQTKECDVGSQGSWCQEGLLDPECSAS